MSPSVVVWKCFDSKEKAVIILWQMMIFFFLFQCQVRIFDNADKSRTDVTNVTISVIQNPSGPLFSQDIYQITISDNYQLGVPVINTTAVDQDGVSFLLFNSISTLYHTISIFNDLEKEALWKYCGKRRNAGNQHFLLFPQCFLSNPRQIWKKCGKSIKYS